MRVLLVEDDQFDAELMVRLLRKAGYELSFRRVDSSDEMRAALLQSQWDIVLADYRMPKFSAPEALAILKEERLDLPFIVISGGIGEATAVAAMKAGAHDYLMKDNLARLVPAIEREIREASNRAATRRTAEALGLAREIQQHLFPKKAPEIPGLEVAGISQPADEAGGDYFDFLTMPHDTLGLVVGDVTGHGVGPALLMSETRAYLRLLSKLSDEPGEIVTRANAALAEDLGGERFVSVLFAHIDVQHQSLRFVNAGHPPGYVFTQDGEVRTLLKRGSLPLGLRGDVTYASSSPIRLSPGEIVVLLTDGFEEAVGPDNRVFGMERVINLIREHRHEPAQKIVKALCDETRLFLGNIPQADDVTVIVAKVKEIQADANPRSG